jgi:hypothetical protein
VAQASVKTIDRPAAFSAVPKPALDQAATHPLQQMLEAGISRWHPNPVAAMREDLLGPV